MPYKRNPRLPMSCANARIPFTLISYTEYAFFSRKYKSAILRARVWRGNMKVDTANRRPGKLRVYKTSKFVPVVIMIVLCCLLFSCSDKAKPVATATGDAERCLVRHDELNAEHLARGENLQALYGVVQGARDETLRRQSANFLGQRDFDGYGILKTKWRCTNHSNGIV